jgi:preprotein translocase subunit SecF
MIELLKGTNIDFMGMKKYTFIFSCIIFVIGLLAIVQILLGKANLGVDFAGGTSVQIRFSKPVKINEVRGALIEGGFKDFDLQDLPAENKILIRFKRQDEQLNSLSDRINLIFSQRFSDKKPAIDAVTEIGPKIGARLKKDALWAIVMATLGLLIYIGWRFQFRFAIGAIVATLHDVLAVLGIFYILNKEINLIFLSAVLTIAGYSLTDTVVVFDRIRENIKRFIKDPIDIVINKSVNEVLSRTIITSLTTLFAALALFLFGGEVIHDFSLAILIGIVVGTYSSVFVASPIVGLLNLMGKKNI